MAGRNSSSPSSPSGSTPVIIEHQQHHHESTNGSKGRDHNSATNLPQHQELSVQNGHLASSVVHSMQTSSQNISSIGNARLIHSSSSSSSSTHSVASSATNASTVRLQASSSSTSTSSSSLVGGVGDSGTTLAPNVAIKKTSSYDVKAFQKEAVMSYVKVYNLKLPSRTKLDTKLGVMAN